MFGLPVFCIALAICASASAQTALTAELQEDYSGRVSVSGSVLVGLTLGAVSGQTDPREMLLNVPDNLQTTQLCLAAKTRDGQYWAAAELDKPASFSGLAMIEPSSGWSFLKELRDYSLSDYAAMIRIGEGCSVNPDLPVLPVQYSDTPSEELSVSINSQRAFRVQASLVLSSGEEIDADCDKPGTASVRSTAFNSVCRFDLTGRQASGEAELVILRQLRVGPREDTFPIRLP